MLTRMTTGRASSQQLWQYYWDTIEACLPPDILKEAMREAGFVDVKHHTELAIFYEYTARKP